MTGDGIAEFVKTFMNQANQILYFYNFCDHLYMNFGCF